MSAVKGKKQFGSAIINEVKEMVSQGKTQKEIAEFFGLKNKFVIKQLLKRERRKENRIAVGIVPRAKGRPRKIDVVSEQGKDNEIKRLKMEIELLRSFLQITGRK
ncbi:imidazolonepropionase [Clostridium algoriphilum]|uniref:imidazolonepropionase n=1 Tax=Clostridium algoriphilum TaxID=198347 RepID=UPI001CF37EE7|nr:imidazolonepropionase [Clostridium algoriphilum]MCB2296128.1 imidazolonepropionase [Clostridium algoriphilum]